MPFPQVNLPQQTKGTVYSGSFYIGSGWPEEFKGTYTIFSTYLGETNVVTPLGNLAATQTRWDYKMNADSTRHSHAYVYFNSTYGIVRMEATGLLNDTFEMELVR